MKLKTHSKLISMLLAVLFLLGACPAVFTISASAATVTSAADIDYTTYTTLSFNTPEEKLATMTPYLESDDYILYVNDYSGEIALQQRTTGEIVFSNPYDVASSVGSTETKQQLLSQIVVQYTDSSSDDGAKYMYSFTESTLRDQVKVKNIKNGVRVEYVLGLEETRKLVPRWISQTRFEEKILRLVADAFEEPSVESPTNWYVRRFKSFYDLKSLDAMTSEYAKQQLKKAYPIVDKFNIYVFAVDASTTELNWVESYIKMYCPDYTFEEMTKDHEECGYNESENQSPVFKMALEYTLEEDGLSVEIPVNGLRYDSTRYTLESISPLPYMGAGNTANDGYLFFPDGSGALFDFQTSNNASGTNIRSKVYGIDFAYHTISGKYQQPLTTAVFGIVEDQEYYTYSYEELKQSADIYEQTIYEDYTVSRTVMDMQDIEDSFGTFIEGSLTVTRTQDTDIAVKNRTTGFFAIIEEGESLAEIEAYRAGTLSNYNAVRTYFNPRPKDEYVISGNVSVTSTSSWTVVSDRKYNGNITIKYMILSDPDLAAESGKTMNYEPTYVGMAQAYRDYLVNKGVLTALTTADLTTDAIPLYIESFGSISASDQFLSVPITVQKPLTTFEDVITMYDELSAAGVTNVNFRLTGFANGGLYYTVPSSLNWDSAVGGKSGFENLVAYAQKAAEQGNTLGIFPDFDFAYVMEDALFDATNLKDHAIRTIDGRYATKRVYKTTNGGYVNYFQYAISPSCYSHFYEKLVENYAQYGLKTLSVASLGSALNSDFDDDDAYNREDDKVYTVEAFRYLSEDAGYTVMTDVANSYTWKYVDYILNLSLDSSRYTKATNSVPFLGIVLHGYMQFAGSPMNMEGDINYAKLKALESGAGAYFTLSYRNTDLLKEDEYYSQYYSVRYDIWKDEVISLYLEMNDVLADVQLKEIIDHEFLTGVRVLDETELSDLIQDTLDANTVKEQNALRDAEVASIQTVAEALAYVRSAAENAQSLYQSITSGATSLQTAYTKLQTTYETAVSCKETYEKYLASSVATQKAITEAKQKLDTQVYYLRRDMKTFLKRYYDLLANCKSLTAVYEQTQSCVDYLEANATDLSAALMQFAKDSATALQTLLQKMTTAEDYTDENGLFSGNSYSEICADAYGKTAALIAQFIAEEEFDEIYKPAETQQKEEISEEEEASSLIISDDGNIVAVTYGSRTSDGTETAYKTFILNYNDFGVKVEYDGVTYFVASEDYVTVTYQK